MGVIEEFAEKYAQYQAVEFAKWLDNNCTNFEVGVFRYQGKAETLIDLYKLFKSQKQ